MYVTYCQKVACFPIGLVLQKIPDSEKASKASFFATQNEKSRIN